MTYSIVSRINPPQLVEYSLQLGHAMPQSLDIGRGEAVAGRAADTAIGEQYFQVQVPISVPLFRVFFA